MTGKLSKQLEREKREEERKKRVEEKEAERIRKDEEKTKREEEKRKKDAEKEQERLRKEEEKLKREEDKRRKDQEKETERLTKEAEKRKRDEEKEQERLKREEDKRKKDEEKEQERLKKEEDKRKRDETKENERLKRESEKRKRDDEKEQERLIKKQKQEELENSAKRQAVFMQGFLRKQNSSPVVLSDSGTENNSPDYQTPRFKPMPFQLKTGMALAPTHRRTNEALECVRRELFSCINQDSPNQEIPEVPNYLVEIKKRGPRRAERTEVIKIVDDDIEIINPNIIENPAEAGLIKWRMKLLQFHSNRRPPYWGTCKRQIDRVSARRPFAKEDELDYDFDSDDEWEQEPEDAEDIGDKDDADREEDENCEGVDAGNPDDSDDDFMVPHGYLSDDEGGGPEFRDKEALKSLEEQFYNNLQQKRIAGLPQIDVDILEQWRMIFSPGDPEDDGEVQPNDEDNTPPVIDLIVVGDVGNSNGRYPNEKTNGDVEMTSPSGASVVGT